MAGWYGARLQRLHLNCSLLSPMELVSATISDEASADNGVAIGYAWRTGVCRERGGSTQFDRRSVDSGPAAGERRGCLKNPDGESVLTVDLRDMDAGGAARRRTFNELTVANKQRYVRGVPGTSPEDQVARARLVVRYTRTF
jgi:hypothetical protein